MAGALYNSPLRGLQRFVMDRAFRREEELMKPPTLSHAAHGVRPAELVTTRSGPAPTSTQATAKHRRCSPVSENLRYNLLFKERCDGCTMFRPVVSVVVG
jgi:hypothetical protein